MKWRHIRTFVYIIVLALALWPMGTVTGTPAPQSNGDAVPSRPPIEVAREESPAELEKVIEKGVLIPLPIRTKIDPQVLKELYRAIPREGSELASTEGSQTTFLVYLREKADLEVAHIQDKIRRREAVVSMLRETASRAQQGIVAELEAERAAGHVTAFQPYWIFNGLAVTGDLHALLAVASRPEVEYIRPNRTHYLPPRPEVKPAAEEESPWPWNIAKIRADLVRGGFDVTGAGVVVANMDTGVAYQHPALLRKYRGYQGSSTEHNYNWFDATGAYPMVPADGHGHGTHTMGTIVGSEPDGSHAIGVAPGARWVAVKIFSDEGKTTDAIILRGFQWILAPTDLLGTNPEPSKAPDIVSNSWGSEDSSDTTFLDAVRAWRAAGIFSVFAAGNEGPGAGTVGSPASFPESFAVGATDMENQIAGFSSRGPSPWGEIKPEAVAPGVDIYSSVPGGQYERGWNGTSMSTPHVAGLAALLWHADRKYNRLSGAGLNPTLTITDTERIIQQTALELGPAGPDNAYGWGLIDAYQAVRTVIPHGTFWGRIVDRDSAAPVENALITMVSREHGGMAKVLADAQGYYTFSVASGLYDVTATQFYYEALTIYKVEVLSDTITQLDLALRARPAGTLRGRVSDKSTGAPLQATIEVLDTPLEVHTDRQGRYAVKLPVGTYTIRVFADAAGYRGAKIENMAIAAGATVERDFALAKAPKILLVNADVWRQERAGRYYEDALKTNLYSHDTWNIENQPSANPTAADLAAYDIVIWSQPIRSPGYIGAWPALAAYLDNGGRLFISGQDIGYWDAERNYGATYYRSYLRASYIRDDTDINDLTGAPGSILEGLSLTLNTEDSGQNQRFPSEIAPTDSAAIPLANYRGDGCGGLQIDNCNFRIVYLAFGFEGIGPQSVRSETMARVLAWLGLSRPQYGVALLPAQQAGTGAMGALVTYNATLVNTGQITESFALSWQGNRWPVAILDSTTNQPIANVRLPACGTQGITVQANIPATAGIGDTDLVTIKATSLTQPSLYAEMTLRTLAFPVWQGKAPLSVPRSRLGAVGVGRYIYVIGGEGINGAVNLVNIFDPATETWRTGSPKPTRASSLSMAAIGDVIFAPGGFSGSALKALEVYDISADKWSSAADMPAPRYGHATVAVQGKLYVIGGFDGQEYVKTTWEYDPTANRWTSRADMPHARAYVAAGVVNGKIYIIGGSDGVADDLAYVEEYDPATNVWTRKTDLKTPRMGAAAVGLEGYLYLVGGGKTSYLPTTERYDPATDTWQSLPALRYGRRTLGLASACGGLYAIGGWDGNYAAYAESLNVSSSLASSSLQASDELGLPGGVLTYTVSLVNVGSQELPASSFRNPIPERTTYISGTVTGGAVYDAVSKEIVWAGTVPPRTTKAFTFQVRINPDITVGEIITATAVIDDGLCGPYTKKVSTRTAAPDLSLSQKAVYPTRVRAGDVLSYVITMTNTSLMRAANASLTDVLPSYLSYVTGTVTGGAIYNPLFRRIEWQGMAPAGHVSSADYTWADSNGGAIAFNWIDATGGTRLPGGDDVALGPYPLGFTFEFFGKPYAEFYINTNGQILFGQGGSQYRNAAIPDPQAPNNWIAAFWDDLTCGPSCLYYQTIGTAPHRYTVIEWYQAGRYGDTQSYTFEIILSEGSNAILLQYQTLTGDHASGSSATVGIENETGTRGIQYLYDGVPQGNRIHDRLAIRFLPVPPFVPGAHVIIFRARVADDIPTNTQLINTCILSDGLRHRHVLTATAEANVTDLSSSAKVVDKSWAVVGDTLRYTIKVENGGTISTLAVLTDALPAGLTYVAGSLTGPSGAVYDPQTQRITWQGNVAARSSLPFAFQARIDPQWSSGQTITNTAFIADLTTGTVIARSAGTTVQTADLSPSYKRVSKDVALSGDVLTYTIALVNSAPVAAPNVSVWDPIPTHTAFVSGSVTGGAVYDAQKNAITWTGTVSAAIWSRAGTPQPSEKIITFQVTVGEGLPVNTAIVNKAVITQSLAISYTRSVTTVVNLVDIGSSGKEVSPLAAGSGDVLTYTITLRNRGSHAAESASLTDPLPTWVSYVPGSATGGATYNSGLNRIEWQGAVPGSQPAIAGGWVDSDSGGIRFVWVDATSGIPVAGGDDESRGPYPLGFPFRFFNATYTEFYVNTNGQVLFGAGSNRYTNASIPDPAAPNNYIAAFWDDLVCPDTGGLYYKTFGTAPNRYTVVEWHNVRRLGSSDLLTFQIILYEGSNDILLQYLTMPGTYGNGSSATVGLENAVGSDGLLYLYNGAPEANAVHDQLAIRIQQKRDALPGEHRLSFKARVSGDAPLNHTLTNTVTITDGLGHSYTRAASLVINTTDLSGSSKSVDKAMVAVGEAVRYTITLRNAGTGTARNVQIHDPLPVGATYVPDSATNGAIYDAEQKRIVWSGTVAPGQSLPIHFAVYTNPTARDYTTITNTAWITDGVFAHFTRTVQTILRSPDLSASEKLLDVPSAPPGQAINYTIRIRNSSDVAATVHVTDTLPAGIEYISDSLWVSSGQAAYQDGTITWQGTVVPEGMVLVRFAARVAQTAPPGAQITNTAAIRAGLAEPLRRSATLTVGAPSREYYRYFPLFVRQLRR